MRILSFVDLHNSITAFKTVESRIKKHNADIVCCCGDFTVFEQHIEQMMEKINTLPVPVILIHGNHEDEHVVGKLAERHKNITFIHKMNVVIDGVRFIGWGGGGFSVADKEFERWAKNLKLDDTPIVFLTHAPPYGCKLDYLHDDHYGCQSYMDFVKANPQIKLALSGHFHENFGVIDKVNKTALANPGPDGTVYEI